MVRLGGTFLDGSRERCCGDSEKKAPLWLCQKGATHSSSKANYLMRFVVQEHRKDQNVHWDLMLEEGEHLATWQTPAPPIRWSGIPLTCQKIFDHRLKYRTYEGPVSDNRGEVHIIAAGTYQPVQISDDQWQVRLESDSISGLLGLRKIREDQWQLTFQGDTV